MGTNGRRVVVTGIGPVTPIGVGLEEFWLAIAAGTSGTRALERLPNGFAVDSLRSRVVAAIPEDKLPPDEEGNNTGRHLRLARLAFQLALADARLEELHGTRTGFVLGNAVGGTAAMEASFLAMEEDGRLDVHRPPPGLGRQVSFHTVTHELAVSARCSGAAMTVSTGCTAGLDAINMAFTWVRSAVCDVAITGSAEAPITPVVFAAFDVIGALTRRNHDPEHASRPFERERDGFVLAEGAALLVLEEYSHAVRRGAHIYAELLGSASVSNTYHMTDLPADGTALARCVELALHDARVSAGNIDHVNAHGSSTPQNDLCETNAVKKALGRRAYQVTVNSLKAMVGHALGASNAIEVAACALSLDRQFTYPTLNLDNPGDGCDLDYVPKRGRRAKLRTMVKLSSGFSGIHSALVIAGAS